VTAAGMVLHLQPPQLKQMTHQELCTHVQKLQLSCTNLQHKLTNVNSRANHTEAELKVALQQIRRLKKDLSELRKVIECVLVTVLVQWIDT
jgi:peptidoglycan hydrolase CwlO-like protein